MFHKPVAASQSMCRFCNIALISSEQRSRQRWSPYLLVRDVDNTVTSSSLGVTSFTALLGIFKYSAVAFENTSVTQPFYAREADFSPVHHPTRVQLEESKWVFVQ